MKSKMYTSWRGKADIPSELGGKPVKAVIGWKGIDICSGEVSAVDICRAYMQEVASLACGECSVGYNGTRLVAGLLEKLCRGQGNALEFIYMKALAATVMHNSKCDFCALSIQPVLDALENLETEFTEVAAGQKPVKPGNYDIQMGAPCTMACPARQDVPGYIELIRNHRYEQALDIIRKTNCLPGITGRTCVAFCEQSCVRGEVDEPVSIRALKRVPADYTRKAPAEIEAPGGRKVAVIGAGPAGLACASSLSDKGYNVTVYDEQPSAGGMTFAGIPPYRLPRDVIEADVAGIKAGVDFKFGKRVNLAEVEKAGFDAVFIATGAHQSRPPGIDNWNEAYAGLMQGVKYLASVNRGEQPKVGKKVIVVGGGNTAIDCARTAIRLGADEATIVYRRSRSEMPARSDEVAAAEAEGVKIVFLALPARIVSEGNRVTGTECIRMELGEPDESGRRRPVPVKGSEFTISADMVLPAIGEVPDVSFISQADGLELTSWGSIKADASMATNRKGVFAGGDCVSGPASIVEAIAAGNRAAGSIDRFLKDQPAGDGAGAEIYRELIMEKDRYVTTSLRSRRVQPDETPAAERLNGLDEVEKVYTPAQADFEAERCLRCYRVVLTAF